jgi:hypothetical protein
MRKSVQRWVTVVCGSPDKGLEGASAGPHCALMSLDVEIQNSSAKSYTRQCLQRRGVRGKVRLMR